MAKFDNPKFNQLSRAEKIRKLDKMKAKADEKIEDQSFYNSIIKKYKDRIDAKKASL